jgi:putative component of membrane protein insertase Oxa1/YidC/SpoIIIJ protein YidD
MNIIKNSLINLVKIYRKFISPYKGFHCAHAHHLGSLSCSGYGLKILNSQYSIYESLRLIRHRLRSCSHINTLYQKPKIIVLPLHKNQQGFIDGCDIGGCDGCDLPDCGIADCHNIIPDIGNCNGCATEAANNSASSNFWECLYFSDTCGSCDPFYSSNSVTTASKEEKNPNSIILPNFLLIEDLEGDYSLYKYNLNDLYYKIHNSCLNCNESDIINGNTTPIAEELNSQQVKELFKNIK